MPDGNAKDSNVIDLRNVTAGNAGAAGGGFMSLTSANDPHVADGMRLVRSFMAIECERTRASIIQIVEEIAGHSAVFSKARRE